MLRCVLIVGLGSIGRRHARIVRALYPSVKLIALRHQRDYTESLENGLGVDCQVYSISEAVDCSPDIAIIANPASFHIDVALPLAKAGIHLLVEKPIAADTKKIQQLLDCCKKNNCLVMVAYNLRFLPSLGYLQDCLRRNTIGNILSVRIEAGQNLRSWRPGINYRNSVSAQKVLGGGVLRELSHELDYLLWMFGEVAWVSAYLSKQSNLEIDVEDTAHLLLGFMKDGRQKTLVASVNIDFIRYDPTRRCTVIGESGSLVWDGIEGSVNLYTEKHGEIKLFSDKPERNYTYREELRHFVDCVENERHPLIAAEDGLLVLQVIEAAQCSAEKGGCQVWVR